ncbi:ferredoxin [Iamia majanohamensis]|uniref:Ferredoxin n=1 Tax=Iamia majanohamensis TaxID=467976 RepID=A0AAE9YCV7_9ACTN|nr:ferredoxin [Iamia majanohamensis]WCO68729.1 ferredoxin [Iamia majanohamensis]
MPRIRVDHDECVSSGACVLEEPDLFAYQDGPEALAVALPAAQALPRERMEELAELCPVSAIVVEDDGDPA